MRFRLSKQNMQDLLDGKTLRNGNNQYKLPDEDGGAKDQIRTVLKANEIYPGKASAFLDANTADLEIEVNGNLPKFFDFEFKEAADT